MSRKSLIMMLMMMAMVRRTISMMVGGVASLKDWSSSFHLFFLTLLTPIHWLITLFYLNTLRTILDIMGELIAIVLLLMMMVMTMMTALTTMMTALTMHWLREVQRCGPLIPLSPFPGSNNTLLLTICTFLHISTFVLLCVFKMCRSALVIALLWWKVWWICSFEIQKLNFASMQCTSCSPVSNIQEKVCLATCEEAHCKQFHFGNNVY